MDNCTQQPIKRGKQNTIRKMNSINERQQKINDFKT